MFINNSLFDINVCVDVTTDSYTRTVAARLESESRRDQRDAVAEQNTFGLLFVRQKQEATNRLQELFTNSPVTEQN